MTDAQNQLQNALTTTFLANLVFLSEYDNELYHRVDELSRMIENGTYKAKYSLEFIMENSEFDVYDIVNDKYLYDKNPKKVVDKLVREVEFDEKNSILNIAGFITKGKKEKANRENRFDFMEIKEIVPLLIEDMNEYINATGDFLDDKKKRLKNIYKFIFIGTLLGRHIPRIAQKIDANMYLVLEKNLEIFRLSLFTVDYTILAKNGVIFSIMDSDIEERAKIKRFFDISSLYNYLLKFSTTSINIDKYVDNLLSFLDMDNPTGFDYNRQLYININRTTKYIKDGYKTLLLNEAEKNMNIFKNTPILYIAAGPSLDEHLPWIQENQNKFFIVTIGAAYKKLLSHDIKANMITTLDEQYSILNYRQFDDDSAAKIDENSMILASTITNEKVLKKFKQENLFLYEIISPLFKDNVTFDALSIGEITLGMLLKLNAKNIYIIGLDFALNQETGASHSVGSNSGISKLNLAENQNRDTFSSKKSLLKVKGNLKEEVFTTSHFFSSINFANKILLTKNSDVEVFNLSTNGAYIEGTTPKNIDDIKIEKFKNISINSDKLRNSLKESSVNNFRKVDKELWEGRIVLLQNDIKDILNEIRNSNFKTFDELLDKMLIIPKLVYENGNIIFYTILLNYFKIISPSLLYHFNDVKVKNEAKKVNKIKDIFVNQATNLVDDFILCLKRLN